MATNIRMLQDNVVPESSEVDMGVRANIDALMGREDSRAKMVAKDKWPHYGAIVMGKQPPSRESAQISQALISSFLFSPRS